MTSDRFKLELSMKLDRLVVDRLFGDGPWMPDSETAVAFSRMLDELGLQEQVGSSVNTWRYTSLGTELKIGLLVVFMGLHWEWEVPYVLEQNHLLAKEEAKNIYDALESGSDPEAFLRPLVQKAYFQYYGRSKAGAGARSAGVVGTARRKGGSGNRGRPVWCEGSGLNVASGGGRKDPAYSGPWSSGSRSTIQVPPLPPRSSTGTTTQTCSCGPST